MPSATVTGPPTGSPRTWPTTRRSTRWARPTHRAPDRPGSTGGQLLGEPLLVEPAPPLDDATVPDAEDVDALQLERSPGAGSAHQLPLVRTARGEPLDDDVALFDELLEV